MVESTNVCPLYVCYGWEIYAYKCKLTLNFLINMQIK